MTLQEAREQYGPAWAHIESRIAEVEQATMARFLPLVAAIGQRDGVEMLRVVSLSTDVKLSDNQQFGAVVFEAPLDGMPVDTILH